MDGFRTIAAPVVKRSLVLSCCAAALFSFAGQEKAALAALAGSVLGVGYLYHIALGFDRLARRLKAQLPFTIFESVLRVIVAGAAPVLIVGRGPAIGYAAYLAGFVAPLAVAIFTIRNQIRVSDGVITRSLY